MKSRPLIIALLLVLMASATPALAKRPPQDDSRHPSLLQLVERRGGDSHERDHRGRGERRGGYSMSQAVGAVQRATKGKILRAEDRGGDFRIKVLLPGGRVRVYQIDAATGAGLP